MNTIFAVVQYPDGSSGRMPFETIEDGKRWSISAHEDDEGPVEIKLYRVRHLRDDVIPTEELLAVWSKR